MSHETIQPDGGGFVDCAPTPPVSAADVEGAFGAGDLLRARFFPFAAALSAGEETLAGMGRLYSKVDGRLNKGTKKLL